MDTSMLLATALRYHQAGLTVLPNDPAKKYPADHKGWETMHVTEQMIRSWYQRPGRAIGLRDVEGLDFDNKGNPSAETLYSEWYALCDALAPGLPDKLLLEQTPSGGYHIAWRCEIIAGNQKLATRPPTEAERAANPRSTFTTLIETRGKGGQFQVAPSPGYTLIRGDWAALPTITPAERLIALDCARALTQADSRVHQALSTGGRPGDAYNADHADDALALLKRAGWHTMYQRGHVQYLCRPGKERGVSATFGHVAPGVLYVFSSSASPFEPGHAYSPFAVYTELEHGGDYKAAAAALRGVNTATGEIKEPATRTRTEYAAAPRMPIDVNDLLTMERKPTIWYAPSFVREGLGLLVGQPNVGKTPAAIQLAIAIATGQRWLNTVLCRRARVLYLGMEYSPQELIPMFDISRMGQDIPRDWLLVKTIEDDFPTDAAAAVDELEWYLRVMEVRVIIIDVLTAFLPPEKFKQNVYRGDYSELKPYHRLALQYNAAILGVWHASKRESDPKIMYNGSTGMWAAAASRIAMYQDQEQRVRISSFPRMGDRVDWALTQEKSNLGRRWILADASPEPVCSPAELQVFRFLKEHASKAKPLSPATIADMTGILPSSVRTHVTRMFEQNILQRLGNGYYVEDLVAPVAPVADETVVADVAPVALQAQQKVLQEIDAPGADKTEVLQKLHATQDPDPLDALPPSMRMGTRMMLVSDLERNIEEAQRRCEEFGLDYETLRKWAIEQARNDGIQGSAT